MKHKGYAIVRITVRRKVELEVDEDNPLVDIQNQVEKEVEKLLGPLDTNLYNPEKMEILECNYYEG